MLYPLLKMAANGSKFVNNEMDWERISLHQPDISELMNVLTDGLLYQFENVEVKCVRCPNLTDEPFNLAANGLLGSEAIIGCFSTDDEMHQATATATWDLKKLAMEFCNDLFFIGGGCAGTPSLPFNGTLVMNATYSAPQQINNKSCVVFKDTESDRIRMETLQHPDHMVCSMKGNFFVSEGKDGKVIELRVKKRKSRYGDRSCDIINLIHNILKTANLYSNHNIGLGGIMMVKRGSVTHQVLPDNVKINELITPYKLSDCYEYHNSNISGQSVLVSLGTIVVPSVNYMVRLNDMSHNFYSFLNNETGGLFFNDTSDDIEYIGYFNVAKELYVPKLIKE